MYSTPTAASLSKRHDLQKSRSVARAATRKSKVRSLPLYSRCPLHKTSRPLRGVRHSRETSWMSAVFARTANASSKMRRAQIARRPQLAPTIRESRAEKTEKRASQRRRAAHRINSLRDDKVRSGLG